MEKYNYFAVNLIHSEHLLEFTALKDFNRFLITQKQSTIFVLNNSDGKAEHFAISYKGGLLRQATEGFKTLEDYNESLRDQFPDSESFYSARQMGYKSYADYKLVSEAGITNADDYKAMKEKGFAEGFAEWKAAAGSDSEKYSNVYEFYKDAVAKGFESYAEFNKATKNGFADGHAYKIALAKGFETNDDFNLAIKLGIDTGNELEFVRKNNLRDRADYLRFLDLELFRKSGCKHDQCVTIVMLSKLPQNKKISINKLEELLAREIATYHYSDTKALPPWFTIAYNGKQSFVDFLLNNNFVKKYGHYDNDGEYFETKALQDRKVVIDGSNVAHNSQGNQNSKPYALNVIRLVRELKRKGFTDISVIADASLRHRIEDKENLNELKKIADYSESPAETPADIFILNYIKHHHCLLISNDLFREWKKLDPWIALNIDYYRFTFMIKEDVVLLPDLDKA
ncbi:MAG: hypothetical protein AB7P01_17955 [Bacteroidia bacterium]